jgi:hypothetical protein
MYRRGGYEQSDFAIAADRQSIAFRWPPKGCDRVHGALGSAAVRPGCKSHGRPGHSHCTPVPWLRYERVALLSNQTGRHWNSRNQGETVSPAQGVAEHCGATTLWCARCPPAPFPVRLLCCAHSLIYTHSQLLWHGIVLHVIGDCGKADRCIITANPPTSNSLSANTDLLRMRDSRAPTAMNRL